MDSPAVNLSDLTKVFGGAPSRFYRLLGKRSAEEVPALKRINLKIDRGEIFGLVGRNGQGKTTLIKSIAALLIPTAGSIEVYGYDPVVESRAVQMRVGLVTSDERSFYWRLTPWQNMMFFARLYGMEDRQARKRISSLFDLLELNALGKRPFQEISNGNKQRLALVRAMLTDPRLLLLDEPTRSLDPIAADDLRKLIVKRIASSGQKTVLITSHNLTEVEDLCTRVGILSGNELKECATLSELRSKYIDRDRITVVLRNSNMEHGVARLQSEFSDLPVDITQSGNLRIRFDRVAGDETLHRMLKRLFDAGWHVLSCDTKRLGLKAIMEEIERNQGNHGGNS